MIVTLQTERVQTPRIRGGRPGIGVRVRAPGAGAIGLRGARQVGQGLVRRYLAKVTGLSRAQLIRLIGQHRAPGVPARPAPWRPAHPRRHRCARTAPRGHRPAHRARPVHRRAGRPVRAAPQLGELAGRRTPAARDASDTAHVPPCGYRSVGKSRTVLSRECRHPAHLRHSRASGNPASGSRKPSGGQFFVVLSKTSWVRDYPTVRPCIRGRIYIDCCHCLFSGTQVSRFISTARCAVQAVLVACLPLTPAAHPPLAAPRASSPRGRARRPRSRCAGRPRAASRRRARPRPWRCPGLAAGPRPPRSPSPS